MIKVLQMGMTSSLGGIEAYLINYYRNIDKSKVNFDFINIYPEKLCFQDEICNLGGKVYSVSSYYRHPIKYIKEIKKIINENNYDIVHCNMSSAVMLFPLIAAKLAKTKIIIAHAHNNSSDKGIFKSIIHNINRHFIPKFANYYFACSLSAGNWFFGKKKIKQKKVDIIKNPVDIDRFKFSADIRKKIRKELNINDDTLVIGHVGRFAKIKNHEFLIDVFNSFLDINKNSKLLLIGTGKLQDNIRKKVNFLNLLDKVVFLNNKNNVNEIMQAMDVFVFPSKFEGLGIVLVEAQAAGLPVLTTDNMPIEVEANNKFYRKKLSDGAKEWAIFIEKMDKNREVTTSVDSYSVKECSKKLVDIYMNMLDCGGINERR